MFFVEKFLEKQNKDIVSGNKIKDLWLHFFFFFIKNAGVNMVTNLKLMVFSFLPKNVHFIKKKKKKCNFVFVS